MFLMKVRTQIFEPHSPVQREIMEFLAQKNETRTMWVACGSKFGKTIGAIGGLAHAAPQINNTTWRWIAPIYRQSKIGWKYLQNIWPSEPYVSYQKADMTVTIPKKNIELQFWHGQNPEDLEGEGIMGQVKDECAKLKEQVHISGKTTMTMTGGRELNISTPRGRNWFYKGCMNALEEMERAKIEKRQPREVFLTAPTSANPHIKQHILDENRRILPVRLYRQYFEAEFLDDGEVFPKISIDGETWKEEFERTGPTEFWIHPKSKKMNVVAGCDWAKVRDFTVLTVWDMEHFPHRMVGFLRFQGKRYTHQVVDIVKFLNRFANCEMLYHDKTGVGEALDDLLDKTNLVYEGVTFTNSSKANMVNNAITSIEQEEVIFPLWPELIKEFDQFEVVTNELGNMRYAAPEGENSHDDIVFSCCLGLEALRHYGNTECEVNFLEDLPEKEDLIQEMLVDDMDIDPDEGF